MKEFLQSVNFRRLLTVLLLAAVAIGIKKFGGPELDSVATLAAVALAGALKSFLEPGDSGPSTPPMMPLLCLAMAFTFSACGALSPADHAELMHHADKLAQCRAEGHADGGFSQYEACKHREGLDK